MFVLPDAGVATPGQAVRYPDVLLTRQGGSGKALLVPELTIVFEVVRPSSGRIDRIVKLRDYAAVLSIRRYVVVETEAPDIAVFSREAGETDFRAAAVTAGEVLGLPEVGVELPVDDIFALVSFDE